LGTVVPPHLRDVGHDEAQLRRELVLLADALPHVLPGGRAQLVFAEEVVREAEARAERWVAPLHLEEGFQQGA
jgi:hypothetical protein